jgi:SAM-dependent methyltransferase
MSTDTEPGWIEKFGELWEQLGPETRTSLLELLPSDWTFAGKRVLDFGCGAGRTLRHFLTEAEQAEIWGVDIDPTSIELLRDTVCPPLHVMQSGYWPPLEFETGGFDLIWSISVFTHLTDNSIPWLLELHRLLRPGGLLIATFMGRWTSELIAGEPWDENRVGMNVLRHSHSPSEGAPMVLMSEWWVREHWGRAFEVLRIAPQIHNQSWALLRRRDVVLSVQDIERAGDDPREVAALRHNLRQAQREIEALRREAGEVSAQLREKLHEVDGYERRLVELRDYYENSRSWRLTRPLRAVGARARARGGP